MRASFRVHIFRSLACGQSQDGPWPFLNRGSHKLRSTHTRLARVGQSNELHRWAIFICWMIGRLDNSLQIFSDHLCPTAFFAVQIDHLTEDSGCVSAAYSL